MRKTITTAATIISILGILAGPAISASDMKNSGQMMGQSGSMAGKMSGKMDHAAMNMKMNTDVVLPKEGGQSAFATIAEIVVMLKSDPDTDWNSININALREHLVDMNELTLNTLVKSTVENDKIVFAISGNGRTLRAIQTMVPAHAAVITAAGLYNAATEKTETGVIMRISYEGENQQAEIKALGFFGIMASGAQHQKHHLMMARGMM